MYVEHEVFIGLRDVNLDNKVTNTALLAYLEDAGGVHSNLVGYGLNDIPFIKRSWVLLNWKIEIFKRPKYAEKIIVKTWSRGIDKLYAYRDFEILDDKRNVIGIATSKWVLMDIEKMSVMKLNEDIVKCYTVENRSVFEDGSLKKIKEPEEYSGMTEFAINRSLIDVNDHVHNIYFMDIANEVLPMEVYKKSEFNSIRVMYKHEIKLGDVVKVFYYVKDGKNIVTIKSYDEKKVHAILSLK